MNHVGRVSARVIARAFGMGEGWTRPVARRRALRTDLGLAFLLAAAGTISVIAAHSLGSLESEPISPVVQYVIVLVAAVIFAGRRILPHLTVSLAIVHFMALALFAPEMAPVFVLEIFYFMMLFSVIAWSPRRGLALLSTLGMVVASCVWIVADALRNNTFSELNDTPQIGVISPVLAAIVQIGLATVTFLLAAVGAGAGAWWSARREALAMDRAVTIAQQVEQLNVRSVAEERLRIARELHDVVGHHVAVMGIHSAAATRWIGCDTERAAHALTTVQDSSRDATRDLRLMLSALRSVESGSHEQLLECDDLNELDRLRDRFIAVGLQVDCVVLGPVDAVPISISGCVHRVVMEALTNVTRHSTADRVAVRIVIDSRPSDGPATGALAGTLRLTVRDEGEPLCQTSGSGVGLVGLQERVTLTGGTLTYGAASDGGFEVAASFVWSDENRA